MSIGALQRRACRQFSLALIWLAPTIALIVGAASSVHAQTAGRENLAGLEDVTVFVGDLSTYATEAGITVALLRTDVELTLRQNGVRIRDANLTIRNPKTPEEIAESLGSTNTLYLSAIIRRIEETPTYPYNVTLELVAPVLFGREAKPVRRGKNAILEFVLGTTKYHEAVIWRDRTLGYAGGPKVRDAVRHTVRSMTEKFINDFRAANLR
jgi:hypothetical protein